MRHFISPDVDLDDFRPDDRSLVIVGTSKIGEILDAVRSAIERVEGATWAEVAERLTRLGHHEFEDYR